jgi:hypothetical protein
MWLSSLLLASTISTGVLIPVQSSFPQACFIYGEIVWSTIQVSAVLSSNCPIHIERQERLVTMKGRNKTVQFLIPEDPGVHEFFYRWGRPYARLDDEPLEVAFDGAKALSSRRP